MISHGPGAVVVTPPTVLVTPSPQCAVAAGKAVTWLGVPTKVPQVAALAWSQQIWLGASVADCRVIVPPPEAGQGLTPATPVRLHVIRAPVGTAARLVPLSFWSPNSPRKVVRTQEL